MNDEQTGLPAARKGPPSKRPRYVSVVLPSEIWTKLDILKDYAQDEGITMSSRQRIGRDGCITAVLAWLLELDYEKQIEIMASGVNLVKQYPSVQAAGGAGKKLDTEKGSDNV